MVVQKAARTHGPAIGIAILIGFAVLACAVIGWLWWTTKTTNTLDILKQLPIYPGAIAVTLTDSSVSNELSGQLTFEVAATPEAVYTFYDDFLKSHDWQPEGRLSDGGGGGYMKRDGSYLGIEITDGSGSNNLLPWIRVVTDRTPIWLSVEALEVKQGGVVKTMVMLELIRQTK